MDLKSSTVAVTGATGFIGGYLVRALLGRGARVVAAVRSPHKMNGLASDNPSQLEVRKADLGDRAALTRAFEGCDAVLSNAGLVSIGTHSRDELMRANAEGTQNVFEAMHDAGVRRAVMTSSASAYARKPGGAIAACAYVESDPLWQPDAPVTRPLYYAVSKAVAEREAWRVAGERGIDLSVARPSGVFGAHDRTGFTLWLQRFTRLPITVFPTHLYIPNVYAGDLAEAMMRMLERPVASGKAYNVTGDNDVSYWRMLKAFRAAGGRVPRVVLPFPVPLRYAYPLDRAERDLDFANRDPVDAFTDMMALESA